MGVPRDNIKEVAKTGLYVDITGEAEPKGESYCVAIRADMDALPMKVRYERHINYFRKISFHL